MDLNILRLTDSFHFEEKCIRSIQFNGEITNMILPPKVGLNQFLHLGN